MEQVGNKNEKEEEEKNQLNQLLFVDNVMDGWFGWLVFNFTSTKFICKRLFYLSSEILISSKTKTITSTH